MFRLAAEDIDFSTPKPPGPPNNFATSLPASQRFITTAGWDQISGWGRIRSEDLVGLVAAGHIPPEADITAPRWWQPLPAKGSIKVTGRVAAPRAGAFTWEVQYAPGVQPPRWPAAEKWTTVKTATADHMVEGTLATINLAEVRSAIDTSVPPYTPADDPTARSLPEKDAFRVRVVVKTGRQAVADRHRATPGLRPRRPHVAGGMAAVPQRGRRRLRRVRGSRQRRSGRTRHRRRQRHAFTPTAPTAPRPRAGRCTRNRSTSPVAARTRLPGATFRPPCTRRSSPAPRSSPTSMATAHPRSASPTSKATSTCGTTTANRSRASPCAASARTRTSPACQVVRGACDDDGPADARDHLNTVDRAFTSQPAAADLDRGTRGPRTHRRLERRTRLRVARRRVSRGRLARVAARPREGEGGRPRHPPRHLQRGCQRALRPQGAGHALGGRRRR